MGRGAGSVNGQQHACVDTALRSTAVSRELSRGYNSVHFCREMHLLSLAAHLGNLNLR